MKLENIKSEVRRKFKVFDEHDTSRFSEREKQIFQLGIDKGYFVAKKHYEKKLPKNK